MEFNNNQFAYLFLDSLDISLKSKHRLVSLFNEPEDIFKHFSEMKPYILDIIDDVEYDKILSTLTNKPKIKQMYNEALKEDFNFVTFACSDYPHKLRDLDLPPFVLYYYGNIKLLQEELILMAGTRHATRYGVEMAQRFTKAFLENDLVMLTGISDGIDQSVIETCLDLSGKCIIVAAGGLEKIVPSCNADLVRETAISSLVLSEYRHDVAPQKYHYVVRNRILAMLSDTAILMEADKDSNSTGVINSAIEYGKEVFALPGNLVSKYSYVPNQLIGEEKARCLYDPKQVVEIFRDQYYFTPKKIVVLDEIESKIVALMEEDDVHFDVLIENLQMPAGVLVGKLIILEAKGKIKKLASNYYHLIK